MNPYNRQALENSARLADLRSAVQSALGAISARLLDTTDPVKPRLPYLPDGERERLGGAQEALARVLGIVTHPLGSAPYVASTRQPRTS